MRVALRADASETLGAGHVMRCLALADELRARGARTRFICRESPGHLADVVRGRGHEAHLIPNHPDWWVDAEASRAALGPGVDWLVVDHYHLDARWELSLRPRAGQILVLDDTADRDHDCDLLLDQNPLAPGRYDQRMAPACRRLIGPEFALLRPAFHALRPRRAMRSSPVKRLLVFFGGGDASNETGKALSALASLDAPNLAVDVVVGAGNPHLAEIAARCAAMPGCRLHRQVDDMAALMIQADLALGATGVSTWERACLGLPTLAVSVAENQHPIARAAAEAGLLAWLGPARDVDVQVWCQALERALADPEARLAQSRAGMVLVDGLGTMRVADRMAA